MASPARILNEYSSDWTRPVPTGLSGYTSHTYEEGIRAVNGPPEVAGVDEKESRRIAELVVSSLTPDSLRLMAVDLFCALHGAVHQRDYHQLEELLADWVEVADVESDSDQYAQIRAAHRRASKGQ